MLVIGSKFALEISAALLNSPIQVAL